MLGKAKLPTPDLNQLLRFRGEAIRTLYFVFKSRKNGLTRNRFSVIVGVKVDKRSTRRHLLKRRVAYIISKWPQRGYDVLVVAHPPVAELSFGKLKEELTRAGQRAAVI